MASHSLRGPLMEPAVLGGRLASVLIRPLVRKLFIPDGPGAGLVDRPVRLQDLISFRGERRTLGEKEVRRLAGRLVSEALSSPGERPFPPDEDAAVADALADRLLSLGWLEMDDVQAVRLGGAELAEELRRHARPSVGLSADAEVFLDSATEWACLHILEFFTRRSAFVARTLVEQTRQQAELIAKVDELLVRSPRPDGRDAAFERRYLAYVAERHRSITIYGIDLRDSPDRWPLEVAYLSLRATAVTDGAGTGVALGEDPWFAASPGGTGTSVSVQMPAEEALQGHDRVLLRGDAGSGKTTLIQWLAVTAARDGGPIPFVLPLRSLTRDGHALPTPSEFLSAVGCPHTPPSNWAERVLAARRGLVLIDGLDEISSESRHHAREWLLGLVAAFPGNRWLLTSRPSAVRPEWLSQEGFRELTLSPMRRPEIATFVHRWHSAAGTPELEAPLLDSLATKRDLARMATNPLVCGLICALHRERRGYLPTGRKELYEAALSMLLVRRDRERGMSDSALVDRVSGPSLSEEARTEVLQRLAYALVLSGRTEMDQDTALGIVDRCLPSLTSAPAPGNSDGVLRTLLLRTGLLRQPAHGVVDFVHRTFQDYLGARYAVEEGHLDVLGAHAGDSRWEDVIRMAVGHARPRERAYLLRNLLEEGSTHTLLLALACLEHAGSLDPAVRTEVEERAIDLIPPRTTAAAKELALAGPLVLELLPAPDGLSAEEARCVTVTASILGDADPATALGVLRRFRDHSHVDVRRQLSGSWQRFPTVEYADEVLDHLDRKGLFIVCETEEERAALRRMKPWLRVGFRGPMSVDHVIDSLGDEETVDNLSLENNPDLRNLDGLRRLRCLRELWIMNCPHVQNPGSLAGSHLRDLAVFSPIADLDGLDDMNELTNLSLGHPLPGPFLTSSLPLKARLAYLYLGGTATTRTGLRGLSHWQDLASLCLDNLATALTDEDWQEVTQLPVLKRLFLRWPDPAPHVGRIPELPGVVELRTPLWHDAEALRQLRDRLPGLRRVVVNTKEAVMDVETTTRYEEAFPGVEITNGGLL